MRNVPELRFDGFEEEWKERNLSKFISLYRGLTYSPKDITNNTSDTFVIRSSNVKNNSIIDADNVYVNPSVVNTENVKIGDIILVVRNGSRSLIGKHAAITKDMPNTVIGAFMSGVRAKTPDFINALFDTTKFDKNIRKNLGATINQITNKNISEMKFFFTDIEEQEKIGVLFKKLDALIEFQEGKVSKLEDFKKSMLQKMFPKKDELVPEFRFDGFDSNWFVSRLGEVTSLRGGYAFKSQNYIENGIPILRISNINSNGTTNEDYVYHTEILDDDNISLDNGAIVLAMSGATTGKISILKTQGKVYQNQRVGYFTKSDRIDYLYLSVILRSHLFTSQLDKILIAGAQPNISSKDVEDFSFKFPSLAEQVKIGQFFKNLDTQIENEEKLLDSYKIMKKSLLQKMFV